jgi:hypothetical protein
MKKSALPFLMAIFIILCSACRKETLDFSTRSHKTDIEREVNLPLVKGEISFEDLINIKPDSTEIINLLDTLNIYYNLEFDHQDTIQMSKLDSNITIDYIKLYYWFTNDFPIGLDAKIDIYDTTSIIDSILFNANPGEIFLPAAPVDSNGFVIQNLIAEKAGLIDISTSQANNLFNRATSLVLLSHIQANTLSIVKVPVTSFLHFKFSVDAKARYEDY